MQHPFFTFTFTKMTPSGPSLFDVRPGLTSKEVIWIIGLILGGAGYGVLFTLGISSLLVFFHSPRTDGGWISRKNILSIHVLVVLLFNTFLQAWNVQSNIKAIFYTDPDRITFFYHDWQNIFIVFIAMLTDGVLVSTRLFCCYYRPFEFRPHRYGGVA